MLLVSCAKDIKLHDCVNYDLAHVYRLTDTNSYIQNVSWCKDGSWLTLVPSSGNVEVVRTRDNVRLLQSILGVPAPITAVFQRTTKKNIAISCKNGSILVYDIKSRGIRKKFTESGPPASLLDWNQNDSHLAAADTKGQIALWSNATNQKTSVLKIPDSKSISSVRFHRNQRNLLGCASDDGIVVVWDINRGKIKFSTQSHKAPVTDVVFSPQNSNLLSSVGFDRMFHSYDISSGVVAYSVLTSHPLSSIDMAPDGYSIAIGSIRGNIYLYDLRQLQQPIKTISAHSTEVKRILYQPTTTKDNYESVNITTDATIPPSIETNKTQDSFLKSLNTVTDSPKIDLGLNQKSSISACDSFLDAMGLNALKKDPESFIKSDLSNNTVDSSKPDNSNLKIPENKPISSTPIQNATNKISYLQNLETKSNISPVLPREEEKVTVDKMREIIKTEVKEQMYDLYDYLSSQFLNLTMVSCREFLNLEEKIEKIQNSGGNNNRVQMQIEQLQEENRFLKSKINELLHKS